MALTKRTYVDEETIITAKNLNDIQDEIINNGLMIGNTPLPTTAQTLTGAVDEVYGITGDGDLDQSFTATNLTGAANELKDTITNLGSDDIANDSTNVSGATVTAAVDSLKTSLSGLTNKVSSIQQFSTCNDMYVAGGSSEFMVGKVPAGASGNPSASGVWVIQQFKSDADYGWQLALQSNTYNMFLRRIFGGVWQPWVLVSSENVYNSGGTYSTRLDTDFSTDRCAIYFNNSSEDEIRLWFSSGGFFLQKRAHGASEWTTLKTV